MWKKNKTFNAKTKYRYILLESNSGVLVKYDNKEQYEKIQPSNMDFFNMTQKEQDILKISIYKLCDI